MSTPGPWDTLGIEAPQILETSFSVEQTFHVIGAYVHSAFLSSKMQGLARLDVDGSCKFSEQARLSSADWSNES